MSRARKAGLWLGIVIAALWAGVGPHPADNSPPSENDYHRTTLQRLTAMPMTAASGLLQIGLAEQDITPAIGHPLAGYGARNPKAAQGIDTPLFARALTLSVADKSVTILTADILLINKKMAEAIYSRSGLSRDQLYITATHTHSGPGGWGDGLLEALILGAYDAAYFDKLAQRLTETVLHSRTELRPAEFAQVQAVVPASQKNRLDSEQPTNDVLSALLFRTPGSGAGQPPLAILTTFGAHPTILNSRTHKLSGDYPAYMMARLKQQTGAGMVLFASGSVGDASPVKPSAEDRIEQARLYGETLADHLARHLKTARFQQQITLASLHLPVEMPKIRFPLGRDWTLGPMVTRLLGDEQGWLSGLRIGSVLLFGFPGDYAGHLAMRLADQVQRLTAKPVDTVTTSFNGDFKGYLVSRHWFETLDTYETRDMNYFGPWGGEYLNEMALAMAERLLHAEQL